MNTNLHLDSNNYNNQITVNEFSIEGNKNLVSNAQLEENETHVENVKNPEIITDNLISSENTPVKTQSIPLESQLINKVKVTFKVSLSLAINVVAKLNWESSSQDRTVRQAIIDHLVKEFKQPKNYKNFLKLFCKLMDFDNFNYDEVFDDMSFFSKGSLIRHLFNEKDLLDVQLQKLSEIKQESDAKELVSFERKPFLTLVSIMGCFEKFISIEENRVNKIVKSLLESYLLLFKKNKKTTISTTNTEELIKIIKGYQLNVKCFLKLTNELKEFSQYNHFNTDQQCLRLNQITYRLIKYIITSGMQIESLKKALIYNKTQIIILILGSGSLEMDDIDELNRDDDSQELKNEEVLNAAIRKKSLENPFCPLQGLLAMIEELEDILLENDNLYYSFSKGMITFLNHQEVLLTNSTAAKEEIQDTSEWMGSLQKAEKNIKLVKTNQLASSKIIKKESKNRKKTRLQPGFSNSKGPLSTLSESQTLVKKSQGLEKNANKVAAKKKSENRKKETASIPPAKAKFLESDENSFNIFTQPEKKEKNLGAPQSLNISLKTAVLSHEVRNYYHEWHQAIEAVCQLNKGKVNGKLKSLAALAAKETEKHLIYSTVGFEQFIKAIRRKDWSSLPQTASMLILDIFAINEQLLRIAYVDKFNQLNDDHDLVENAKSTNIFDGLSAESQDHLSHLNLATYWVRYPVNSLRYYRLRKEQQSLPKALIAIENGMLIAAAKLNSRKKFLEYIDYIFNAYKQQCHTSYEIISAIKGKTNPKLHSTLEDLVNQIELFHQQVIIEIPISIEGLAVLKEPEKARFTKEIIQLRSMADDIQYGINLLSLETPSSLKYHLKESLGHIVNFIETLHLYDTKPHSHSLAWIYRNCLKIQLIFESLYTSRHIAKMGYSKIDHDLFNHHTKLGDAEELNPSAFSFNKSMQYTSSQACHDNAFSKVENLQKLEQMMNISVSIGNTESEQWNGSFFEQIIHEFIQEALPLLNEHIKTCLEDIKMLLQE